MEASTRSEASDMFVCIGDELVLRFEETTRSGERIRRGFAYGLHVSDASVHVSDKPYSHATFSPKALFKVSVMQQYSGGSTSPAAGAELQTQRSGSRVTYGQTIQLQHVVSHRMLTVCESEAGVLEPDCLSVALDPGSDGAWWTLVPRYKLRQNGGPVRYGEAFALVSTKWNVSLHVSRAPFADNSFEVTAGSQASLWRPHLYSSYAAREAAAAAGDSPPLQGGAMVRLFAIEDDGYLAYEWTRTDEDGADVEAVVLHIHSRDREEESKHTLASANSVFLVEHADRTCGGPVVTFVGDATPDLLCSPRATGSATGELALAPPGTGLTSQDTLFILDVVDADRTTAFSSDDTITTTVLLSHHVRLIHAATRRLVLVTDDDASHSLPHTLHAAIEAHHDLPRKTRLVMGTRALDSVTDRVDNAFSLSRPTHAAEHLLHYLAGASATLRAYLELWSLPLPPSLAQLGPVLAVMRKLTSMAALATHPHPARAFHGERVQRFLREFGILDLVVATLVTPFDMTTSATAQNAARKFLKRINKRLAAVAQISESLRTLSPLSSTPHLWHPLSRPAPETTLDWSEGSVSSVTTTDSAYVTGSDDDNSPPPAPLATPPAIDPPAPWHLSDVVEAASSRPRGPCRFVPSDLAHPRLAHLGEALATGYALLATAVRLNPFASLRLAAHTQFFVTHIGHGFGAAGLLIAMYKDNRLLLKRVEPRFVESVVASLSASPHLPLLRLLAVLCTLDGKPLPRNQSLIATALLDAAPHLLPAIRLDSATAPFVLVASVHEGDTGRQEPASYSMAIAEPETEPIPGTALFAQAYTREALLLLASMASGRNDAIADATAAALRIQPQTMVEMLQAPGTQPSIRGALFALATSLWIERESCPLTIRHLQRVRIWPLFCEPELHAALSPVPPREAAIEANPHLERLARLVDSELQRLAEVELAHFPLSLLQPVLRAVTRLIELGMYTPFSPASIDALHPFLGLMHQLSLRVSLFADRPSSAVLPSILGHALRRQLEACKLMVVQAIEQLEAIQLNDLATSLLELFYTRMQTVLDNDAACAAVASNAGASRDLSPAPSPLPTLLSRQSVSDLLATSATSLSHGLAVAHQTSPMTTAQVRAAMHLIREQSLKATAVHELVEELLPQKLRPPGWKPHLRASAAVAPSSLAAVLIDDDLAGGLLQLAARASGEPLVATFGLICAHFTKAEQLLELLASVKVLVNPLAIAQYQRLAVGLAALETVPVVLPEAVDRLETEVIPMLRDALAFCETGHRDILLDLGCHTALITFTQRVGEAWMATASRKSEHNGAVRHVLRLIFRFLEAFVRRSPDHQAAVVPYVDALVTASRWEVGATLTLAALYSGNYGLCARIPTRVLQHALDQIKTTGLHRHYLRFLACVLCAMNHTITRTQNRVLALLQHPSNATVLVLLLDDNAWPAALEEHASRTSRKSGDRLLYHLELMRLLGSCANTNRLAEVKCQMMIPLETVVSRVLAAYGSLELQARVRGAYLHFLREVYVDNDMSHVALRFPSELTRVVGEAIGMLDAHGTASSLLTRFFEADGARARDVGSVSSHVHVHTHGPHAPSVVEDVVSQLVFQDVLAFLRVVFHDSDQAPVLVSHAESARLGNSAALALVKLFIFWLEKAKAFYPALRSGELPAGMIRSAVTASRPHLTLLGRVHAVASTLFAMRQHYAQVMPRGVAAQVLAWTAAGSTPSHHGGPKPMRVAADVKMMGMVSPQSARVRGRDGDFEGLLSSSSAVSSSSSSSSASSFDAHSILTFSTDSESIEHSEASQGMELEALMGDLGGGGDALAPWKAITKMVAHGLRRFVRSYKDEYTGSSQGWTKLVFEMRARERDGALSNLISHTELFAEAGNSVHGVHFAQLCLDILTWAAREDRGSASTKVADSLVAGLAPTLALTMTVASGGDDPALRSPTESHLLSRERLRAEQARLDSLGLTSKVVQFVVSSQGSLVLPGLAVLHALLAGGNMDVQATLYAAVTRPANLLGHLGATSVLDLEAEVKFQRGRRGSCESDGLSAASIDLLDTGADLANELYAGSEARSDGSDGWNESESDTMSVESGLASEQAFLKQRNEMLHDKQLMFERLVRRGNTRAREVHPLNAVYRFQVPLLRRLEQLLVKAGFEIEDKAALLVQNPRLLQAEVLQRFNFRRGLSLLEEQPGQGGRVIMSRDKRQDVHGEEGHVFTVLLLLQALCENHHHEFQEYLREQVDVVRSFNVVAALARYVSLLASSVSAATIHVATQAFATLAELCQGPNPANQRVLADSSVIEVVNSLLSSKLDGCAKADVYRLRKTALTAVAAIVEGSSTSRARRFEPGCDEPPVHGVVLSKLNVNVLQQILEAAAGEQGKRDGVRERGRTERDVTGEAVPWEARQQEARAAFRRGGIGGGGRCEAESDTSQSVTSSAAAAAAAAAAATADAQFEEAVACYILLRSLHDKAPDAPELQALFAELDDGVGAFFERQVSSVEIAHGDAGVERMYFKVPSAARLLNKRSRRRLVWDVARDDTRLRDFLDRAEDLLDEMHHRSRLEPFVFWRYVGRHEQALRNTSLLLAVVINALLLVGLQSRSRDNTWRSESIRICVTMFGGVQTATSGLVVLIYLVSQAPLVLRRYWRSRAMPASAAVKGVRSAVYLCRQPFFCFHLLYVAFAVFGNVIHPAFFSYHLLDIVTRSETLRSVTLAIMVNAKAIGLTVVLGLVWMYMYALAGFVLFRSDFDIAGSSYCTSLLECIVTVTNLGLRSSGGIGDQMVLHPYTPDRMHSYGRVAYDLSYYFVFVVLFLNLLLAIIVDTFAALRTRKHAVEHDIQNKCFVCGLSRDDLTRDGPGFVYHVKREHSMWAYVALFEHLRGKDFLELTGREGYVLAKLERRDPSFFPHTALSLER
ncbi:inositol 1,4,5-trisphosphate receptor type 3 [Thecamonas trahens ATCC 50062]|uniref:Inositol 1,4,5-trisphosphate receptor type 3 n=1 Tax=Thecamonas trahens ATCC 50062 TaxID=461836 RepID=A0A0L0D838_THETB|nr:inositol 1,4,5-trisphosphate receptor type 3 [Thecamonas trahens ATCC 50062]KNC48385.1 inositol 1,4,5-trisphosphate receptor type 3 [Thecamonas trahens ATCC 50062]|eukprot:XP_013758502.1 inositol 1,4,5-trisphosphate receptor type 3 [Thecamonas trahens ATCC 50062]